MSVFSEEAVGVSWAIAFGFCFPERREVGIFGLMRPLGLLEALIVFFYQGFCAAAYGLAAVFCLLEMWKMKSFEKSGSPKTEED